MYERKAVDSSWPPHVSFFVCLCFFVEEIGKWPTIGPVHGFGLQRVCPTGKLCPMVKAGVEPTYGKGPDPIIGVCYRIGA